MYIQFFRMFVVTMLLVLLLVNCGGGGGGGDKDPGGKDPVPTANVVGTVTGSGGLAGVTVSAGGITATTDNAGNYNLENVPVPASARLVLTFEKDGYATYQRSVMVEANKTFAVAAKMTPFHYSEVVDSNTVQNLDIPDPDNPAGPSLAKLDLPANAVNAAGNVTVNIAVGDPSTDEGRDIFPGDYMASPNASSEPDTELESVAFAEITIKDGTNEIETLDVPADLTVKLPDEFQTGGAKAGTYDPSDADKDSIEWWSYNEDNGSWIREDADPSTPDVIDDAAVIDIDGVLYAKAKVTHFSWWNADRPVTEHGCFCVRVVDDQGNPVQGAMVMAQGVTYNGRSTPVMTGADGIACVNVKRSTDTQQERVKIYVEQGGARFLYVVTDAAEGDVTSNEINTPTAQGSTNNNSGQCVTLANDITLVYDGTLTGTVTRESTGAPIAGFTVYTDFGESTVTDNAGVYTFAVPVGSNVSVFAPGLVSQTVFIPNSDPVVADFSVPNLAPVFDSVTRVPAGNVAVSTTVGLTAVASDPDSNNPVTYNWSASAGTLDAATGSSVNWTAPATIGTAQITVTATDTEGAETEQQLTIVIVEPTGGGSSNLKVTIKDNPTSNQPVSGATVVFYNTDNRTIAPNGVITTSANGEADFGNVGRETGSFSVLYQLPDEFGGGMESNIDSYIDIPMGEIVYYIEDYGLFGTDNECLSNSGTNVSVNFNEVHPAATQVSVEPGYYIFPVDSPSNNLIICDNVIQDDGTISLLAASFSYDASTFDRTFHDYGYLLDQTVNTVSPYNITLNNGFLTYGYTTIPPTPVYVGVNGVRNGVELELGRNQFSNAGSTGNMLVADNFPVDKYLIYASTVNAGGSGFDRFILKIKPSLAQTETIDLPDTVVSNSTYDPATDTVSWTISGTDPVDFTVVDFDNYNDNIYWSVYMPATSRSWQVMELPAFAGVDTNDLTNTFCDMYVDAEDVNNMVGHVQVWELFTSGADLFDSVDQFNVAAEWVENISDLCINNNFSISAQSLEVPADQQPDTADKIKSKALKSIKGILRR